MDDVEGVLQKLGLQEIEGYTFQEAMGGGSALTSLYKKNDELIVFKFLICPRNPIELERFKLEYSVLDKNRLNFCNCRGRVPLSESNFLGPEESYPLPKVKYPLTHAFDTLVSYFGYEFESGVLLSKLETSQYNINQKTDLLFRLASALNYFNRTGYSHRDLHPDNILLLDGHLMVNVDRAGKENNPKIKFLDMGNCQRTQLESDWMYRIERDLDEDAVFEDNNRRLLSSFISMPPDFLDKGENIRNYDTWAFGIYAYQLFFNCLPSGVNDLGDVARLRDTREFSQEYKGNLSKLPIGLRLILNHLLSPKGEMRPSSDAVVRLFSWPVQRSEEFIDENFIKRVIHNDGFDPDYDPHEDYY